MSLKGDPGAILTLLLANFMPQNDPSTEKAKVAAAQQDPAAFDQLYLDYAEPLFRYVYSRLGSRPDAEDVTAQTFLAALEQLPRYRHSGHFAAWLFSIARNKANDHFRRRTSSPLDEVEAIAAETNIVQEVGRREQRMQLAQVLAHLNEDQRELLRLRYVADLSYEEMGKLLRRSTDAVKKATYRLLDNLQDQLKDSNE